jgi:Tfp pilus assembly protein PilF
VRPPARSAAPTGPALDLVVCALLAAVVFAAYAGAFGHTFVALDDWVYVKQNLLVLGKRYGELLRAVVSHNYHPLTMVSLAWNVGVPLSPRPFLVTNVTLHAANALLVFWLVRLLSGRRLLVPAFVALLFGLHPMHVESVAWVSERKDVLYAFFFLGAAIAYLGHLERRGRGLLALAFALFLLSCLSKGMAVSFPLVMVLLDVWRRRPLLERGAVLEKLPFVAVALLFGLAAIQVQAGGDIHGLLRAGPASAGVIRESLPYTPLGRAVLPAYGAMMYAWHLMVPAGMAAFHPYPSPAEAARLPYLLGPLFLLAMVLAALWDLRRSRIVSFGAGWFLATLLFVLQWIPVGMAITADRYTYLPYVGLAFAWAMGMQAVLERSRPAGVALWCASGLFVALLFPATVRQVGTWTDTTSLWTRVIEVHPGCGLAYAARGDGFVREGRIPEAMSDLRTALRLGDRSPQLYDGLGSVYGLTRQPDSALVMFDRALSRDPGQGTSYHNRALALIMLGRPREALPDLDRALALVPAMAPTFLATRGFARMQLGAFREAAEDLGRAIAAGSQDPNLLTNRGVCELQLGDTAAAVADLRRALVVDPGDAAARARLQALGRGDGPPPGAAGSLRRAPSVR